MDEQTNKLDVLSNAQRLLAEIRTTDDAKHLMARAEAARAYAKEIGMGLEVQNIAAEIRLRAQRAAGGVLMDMKNRGELQLGIDHRGRHHDGQLTLEDLGITTQNSKEWQQFFKAPITTFNSAIDEAFSNKRELTTNFLYTWLRSYGKQQPEKKPAAPNPVFVVKQALETVKSNIALLELSARNGDAVAAHSLRLFCQTLTEMAVNLVNKGYSYAEPESQD